MKPYLFVLIMVLFVGNKGFSQTSKVDTTSPQARATELTQSMTCELGLDEPQQDVVQAINLEAYQSMDKVTKLYASNAKRLDEEQAQIETDRNTKLKNNLTPKQWAWYERLSNGQERLLKITKVCRKPDQDAYGF